MPGLKLSVKLSQQAYMHETLSEKRRGGLQML